MERRGCGRRAIIPGSRGRAAGAFGAVFYEWEMEVHVPICMVEVMD